MADEKTLKVMIVDDDQFLLNMYSMKFKNSGFEVDTAVGGQEAINKIKDGAKPDILLLDMVMPVMDGMELLRIIHRDNLLPGATIIVLSNQNQPGDIEKAKELGISSYIVKASSVPSEVVAEVSRVVGVVPGGNSSKNLVI